MGILDNLEAYLEADTKEKCHYCQAVATYNDLAEVDRTYKVVGVCACHSFKGLSSQLPKHWEDKSQWITHCPICFCSVTYQLYDFHLQYHQNLTPISEIGGGREGIVST